MAIKDLINAVNDDAPKTPDYTGLTLAFDSNPEEEAKKRRLERSTGIPSLLMDDNVRKQAELQQFVTSPEVVSLDKHPRTAEWISKPENAQISHDDIGNLAAIEKLARTGFGNQGGSTLGIASANDLQASKRAKSIGGAFVNSLLASPEKVNEGLAGTGVMLADFVDWSLAAFPDETGMRKKVADTARESKQFWSDAAKKKMGTFAPQSAESYFSQAGSSIGTSLLAAPFGAAGQNAALGMFGLFADGGYQEMRDKNISMPVAGALSLSNSAMEGLTEKLGLDAIYKGTGPILKKAIGFVLGDLAGEEINTLYNSLVDKVTISPDMSMGDVVQQVIDTAIVTSIAGPAQGVSMSGAAKASEKLYGQFNAQQEAKKQSDFLLALGDSVKASKTFARLPSAVQELVKSIKQDGAVQDVYVPVERFTELFQSQGMDARQTAEQILSDPSRYYEAVQTGGDVAIPLEEFAMLADAPFYGELAKDARTSLTGMTAREAEEFGQDQEKTVNDLLAELDDVEVDETSDKYQDAYQRIYDDTYGSLIGINQNPSEAQANATLRAKGLATLAQRYGYDADALMAQFPINVTRGDLPGSLQKPVSFSEQQQAAKLSGMLDALRSGKQVKESEMFGPSLGELLREKGVKDDRGDLASLEVDSGIKFKKKMLRKDGLSLDKAREIAVEQGYLPEGATTEDLIDALANEMRGQAKYSPEFVNHSLIDQNRSNEELAQWLDMMGVDLAQMDNSRIMEMMQQSVSSGTTMGQGVDDYGMDHRPPGPEDGAPLNDLTGGGSIYPEDIYSSKGLQYYGTGEDKADRESMSVIQSMRNKPNGTVTVYRAVPSVKSNSEKLAELEKQMAAFMKRGTLPPNAANSDGKWYDRAYEQREKLRSLPDEPVNKIEANPGDWVTLSKTYAKDHGEGALGGEYKIISKKVKASEIFTNGDSINEFGYWPKGSEKLYQEMGKLDNKTLAEVVESLEKQFPDMKLSVTEGRFGISINKIEFPKDQQGKGQGSEVFKAITDYADATGQIITATPSTDFGGTKSRIVDFNKRFGFVENKGKNKDFAISDTMYPLPQKANILFQGSRGSAEGHEALSVRKTQAEGMLLTAVMTNGVTKVSGIGATHYDVKQPMKVTADEGVTDANGFVTPDGKFLDRKQSLVWLKENRPDIYKQLDKVTKANGLESQDYAHAEGVTSDTDALINSFMARTFGTSPQMLFQKPDKKRAYIKFGDNMTGFEIALLKDADASSFLHELGHYYHEVLGRLATSEGAPEQLKSDYDTLLKWLGATDKQSLTVEQSEKFARGFEAYLYEGNAPSQELRGVFQRFKTWLKAVYSSLKSLNVELTDDVRGVFDRLLATDEEIKAAEGEQKISNIFASAKDAGMSESVFEAYKKLAEDAHESAKERLEREKLKEVKRTQQAWWKEAREKMLEEVEAEAKQEPVYEAIHFLHNGKLFDGSEFEGGVYKLSGTELNKQYDATTVKALRKKLGDVYRNEGGLSPRMVSEMFGFSSTDEMITKMMEAPKLKDFVQAETDLRMNEQYGMMNPAEIAEEAINSVHNDEQAKLLREELKAIRRKVKEVKPFVDAEKNDVKAARKLAESSIPPVSFFKEAARRHIDSLKVSEILPGKFSRAEAKASKEAFELNGKGKFAEAAAAKQRQLLNHYLYREATEARNESEKISAYMRSLEAGKKQQQIGKGGQDYLEQVNALLDKYEFRRQTGAELEARESLLDWMDRFEKEKGYSPPVSPSVMEEAKRVNYRSLTYGELVDVKETVEAIVHLARAEGKLLRDGLKRDVLEVAEEGAESIAANSRGIKKRLPEKTLPQDLPAKYIGNYFASHRKMSSLARQMDGGEDGGKIWNMLIRPLNEAADKEALMKAEAATELNKIFRVYSALERTKMHKREFIPEINTSMSKWGRIVVALNMGNEGNRQRLGTSFSPAEVDAIVSTLDERDWQFVQNILDMIEGYWPEIEAKEKRINGVAPQKVDAMPIVTKYGVLRGGYFPIKYDREETAVTGAQEEAELYKQMMGGAFTKATTRHGHTEARLEAVNRPLSLSIDNVFQHLNQVIHDLTHHETLVDVSRLLGTKQLQEAMRDHYGLDVHKLFTDGVKDVAIGDIPAQDVFEKFMGYTRVGISTAGLGYNLVTSMMQPLGLTQSMVRIGPQWVAKGVGRWIGSPKRMIETADWIYEKSDFMKTRALTQNREIAEISSQMTVGVIPFQVRDSFFYFIQQMQKVVDIPTWLGQYEKSMSAHGNEADAVAEADQAVIDSQASGAMKDLAGIQKGGPTKKMFTTFYSFFSTTYNLAAEAAARTNIKNPSEVGRFMVDMLMLYTVPTVLTMALKEGIQRAIGGGDDDDELLKRLAAEQLSYIMGGFVGLRELSSVLSGFNGYEGPAGSRFYAEITKLAKEAGQGEADAGLFKRMNSVGGILFHYPSTQVQRVVDGMKEINEGRGNMLSLLFGKPKK